MRKLNFLKWILIILAILGFIGLIGNILAFLLMENEQQYYQLSNSNIGTMKFWIKLIGSFLFYFALLYASLGLNLIKKNNGFTEKSKLNFNRSGLYIIVSSVLLTTIVLIDINYLDLSTTTLLLSFYFLQTVLAFFLFAISDIIKLGKNYQEENELTV